MNPDTYVTRNLMGNSGMIMTPIAQKAFSKASELNLRMTSGYRSPEESVRVGGYKTDDHTKGLAADWSGSKENMDKFAKWAKSTGNFRWIGWQVAGHYDHVHLSWLDDGSSETASINQLNNSIGLGGIGEKMNIIGEKLDFNVSGMVRTALGLGVAYLVIMNKFKIKPKKITLGE